MNHVNGNGYHQDIERIKKDVGEIKTSLTDSIDNLTTAVQALSTQFGAFIRVAENSIPIKAVFWMFLILVLAMVGVEGVKALAALKLV